MMSKAIFSKEILVIIFNNSIPLIGILFFNWTIPNVFIIYWVETILYCIFILVSKLFPKRHVALPKRVIGTIVYLIIFSYCLYIYGVGISIFTFRQEQIVATLVGGEKSVVPSISLIVPYLFKTLPTLLGFIIVNLYNFIFSYFLEFDANNSIVRQIQTKDIFPTRMLILHLTIFIAGSILIITNLPISTLIVFICIKTIVEIKHNKSFTG